MKNDRSLLYLSIFTCITVFTWIIFEFIETVKTTTVSTTVQKLITPLTPIIDTATLDILEQKKE